MYSPNSPNFDLYSLESEQDLNGKKRDWGVIVKISFIHQERLLKAMACIFLLTLAEKQQNGFGTSTWFSYNPGAFDLLTLIVSASYLDFAIGF